MVNAKSAVFAFGSYRLDCPKRLLTRAGRNLGLSPKAFDLLVLLIENRGRVLTKKELMHALWPNTFVGEVNLSFQISILRKALGEEKEWIETLPRYGYRFIGSVSDLSCNPEPRDKANETGHTVEDTSIGLQSSPQVARQPALLATRARSAPFWPVVTLVATTIALVLAWIHFREAAPREPVVRFEILPPKGVTFADLDTVSISPDGERLLFIGTASDGRRQLWLRPLGLQRAEPLAGTELVESAFWSPDSRSIAFFVAGKLKKIALHRGSSQTICDAPVGRSHGSWSRNGVILFDTAAHREIYRVSDAGGEPQPATSLDPLNQEMLHSSPQFLPDGRHFIYFVQSARPENTGIYVASLDSRGSKRLVNSRTNAVYAGTSHNAGYLLFTEGTILMGQVVDLKKLELTGEPVPVTPGISIGLGWGLARAAISASENGVLTYRTRVETELVWLDRQGKRLGVVGEPADYSNPSLSPDEKKLMVSRMDAQSRSRDLWLFDLVSGVSSRFTFDPSDETDPVWSPDASRVAFNIVRNGVIDIYQKATAGTSEPQALLTSSQIKSAEGWSPDGRFFLYRIGTNLWALDSSDKPTGPYAMENPAVSPNGRWVAYTSNDSGRSEVYVESFPPSNGKWQVSTAGGTEPRWRKDGRELYYISGDKLIAVEVRTDSPVFEAALSRPLFELHLDSLHRRSRYQVADNGKRFLVNMPVDSLPSVSVAINWTAQPTLY